VVPLGVDFLEYMRVDDPIGAWAVHGVAGIWGTLSVGLFATGKFGVPGADGADTSTVVRGLFYGGGLKQLKAQLIGSITCVIVVTSVALFVMYAVKAMGLLRISKDGELEGLDIHEHGLPAYHMEFGQGVSYTTLTGAGSFLREGAAETTASDKAST
jgi:Amt family ammonium transporter